MRGIVFSKVDKAWRLGARYRRSPLKARDVTHLTSRYGL